MALPGMCEFWGSHQYCLAIHCVLVREKIVEKNDCKQLFTASGDWSCTVEAALSSALHPLLLEDLPSSVASSGYGRHKPHRWQRSLRSLAAEQTLAERQLVPIMPSDLFLAGGAPESEGCLERVLRAACASCRRLSSPSSVLFVLTSIPPHSYIYIYILLEKLRGQARSECYSSGPWETPSGRCSNAES